MYFINHQQIEERLQFLNFLADNCKQLEERWKAGEADRIWQFAQERVLHLAIETVTDIGGLLIDAFILRDAGSYEDIVEIVYGEGAYSESLKTTLLELVKLRKPLVQNFVVWDREPLHPLVPSLPAAFAEFSASVKTFIQKELE